MNKFAHGLVFAAVWFAVGWAVAQLLFATYFDMALWGGEGKSGLWKATLNFGLTVLPVMLLLGGLPAAIQIWRGRPYRTAMLVPLIICFASTMTVFVIVQ